MPSDGKLKLFFSNPEKPFGFQWQKNLLLHKPLPFGEEKKIVSVCVGGTHVGINRKEGLDVPAEYVLATRALCINPAVAGAIEAAKI